MKKDTKYEKWFPQRLTQLRTQRSVSARDISLSIGQNAGYINSIENGKNFFYICEYLHITPKDFFDVDANDPEALHGMIANLKKLDPEKFEALSKIVAGLIK